MSEKSSGNQMALKLVEPENGRFVVTKSHKLIQAQSTLNAREQKLLAALIAQINPTFDYEGDLRVSLSSAEITRLTKVKSNHIHSFLDKASESIMNAKFIYRDEKSPENFKKMTLTPYSEYENKIFTVQFSSLAKTELIHLSRYASYELKQIEDFSSKYAIRLFELLTDAHNEKRGGKQRAIFTVTDLYFRLGMIDQNGEELSKGYVKQFSKFKSRILLPALEEINEKSNIEVFIDEIKYQRIGRKIGEIVFLFRKSHSDLVCLTDPDLEKILLSIGASKTLIKSFFEKARFAPSVMDGENNEEEYIKNTVSYLNELIKGGMKIDNKAGFLSHLINNFLADAPLWANPYSEIYKGKKVEQNFVKQYFLGKHQFIDDVEQETLHVHGITGSKFYRELLREFKLASNTDIN